MTKLNGWKVGCVAFALLLTKIAAEGQTFKTLVDFDGPNGSSSRTNLVQGHDGSLYGTTESGGDDDDNYGGTVFKISPLGKLTTLYSFCSDDCAALFPGASLAPTLQGAFYGVTREGGAYNGGTVFKITPEGKLTTLYNFCSQPHCADGSYAEAGLVLGTDGDFYGTTTYGGADPNGCNHVGCGTIFKITPDGKLTTLHSFHYSDGGYPGMLIQASDGKFYGVAEYYYPDGRFTGTVFTITSRGAFATLHIFAPAEGGPAALTQGIDGDFYGPTYNGGVGTYCGTTGCGSIFKMTPDGTVTTIYSFCVQQDCADGAAPYGGLVQATDGNFYGTTLSGENYGAGTLFQITPGGSLTTLHTFCSQHGCPDGALPFGGLSQSTYGALYGTTYYGGSQYYDGTIFGLDMGLGPFVAFVVPAGRVGATGGILGQGFSGTTSVAINGIQANFKVISDTYIKATVPPGATTGYVTVTTPTDVLTSNVPFRVIR